MHVSSASPGACGTLMLCCASLATIENTHIARTTSTNGGSTGECAFQVKTCEGSSQYAANSVGINYLIAGYRFGIGQLAIFVGTGTTGSCVGFNECGAVGCASVLRMRLAIVVTSTDGSSSRRTGNDQRSNGIVARNLRSNRSAGGIGGCTIGARTGPARDSGNNAATDNKDNHDQHAKQNYQSALLFLRCLR